MLYLDELCSYADCVVVYCGCCCGFVLAAETADVFSVWMEMKMVMMAEIVKHEAVYRVLVMTAIFKCDIYILGPPDQCPTSRIDASSLMQLQGCHFQYSKLVTTTISRNFAINL